MNDLNARSFRSAAIRIVSFLFLKITNDDEKRDKDTQWSAVKLKHSPSRKFYGSITVSEKLSTYPSPKPAFCPKWKESANVGLREGWVGSFPETR